MKKQKPTYKGVEYDSQEEIEIAMWIEEAIEAGLIMPKVVYQPEAYKLSPKQTKTVLKQLKTKSKQVEKHLLHPHKYTADFKIIFTTKGKKLLPFIGSGHNDTRAVIDVKGAFNQHGGDREFSINQKWTYEKYGVFVNKVIPEKLFKSTWVPDGARLTSKTRQIKKKYAKCKTIEEFLK